jgi:hypothetical protein
MGGNERVKSAELILFNLVTMILKFTFLNLFLDNLSLRYKSGVHAKLWQYISLQ